MNLVLEKSKATYGGYELHKEEGISQGRAFLRLESGELDIVSAMTDEAREAAAIPIRYCLYKGLLGVRVGMGTADRVEQLNLIKTFDELAGIHVGQVFDWPDYAIQKQSGMKVVRLSDFNAGISALRNGAIQLLPLGIAEVAPIAKSKGFAVISNWAIAYPSAYYFFVSKRKPLLAERLRFGFEASIKDKSFDKLFAARIGPVLAASGLDNKIIFALHNPSLPKATSLERKELWHPIVLARVHGGAR